MGKIILETKRCIVREFTMEDMDALFELYEQPGITRFVEPLYDWEKEKEYQKNYISLVYGKYGYGLWMVEDKNHQIIGRIGVERHEYDPPGVLELGYIIAPFRQGRGIATEVCRAVLHYAAETLQSNLVYARIHPQNKASNHLATKLGFTATERFDKTDQIWTLSLM